MPVISEVTPVVQFARRYAAWAIDSKSRREMTNLERENPVLFARIEALIKEGSSGKKFDIDRLTGDDIAIIETLRQKGVISRR